MPKQKSFPIYHVRLNLFGEVEWAEKAANGKRPDGFYVENKPFCFKMDGWRRSKKEALEAALIRAVAEIQVAGEAVVNAQRGWTSLFLEKAKIS